MKEFDGNLGDVCIVPAALNPLQDTNNPSYSERHATPRLMQGEISRSTKVEFLQNVIHEKLSDLKVGDVMVVKRLKNNKPAKKLFVAYNCSYVHLQWRLVCHELDSQARYDKVNIFV